MCLLTNAILHPCLWFGQLVAENETTNKEMKIIVTLIPTNTLLEQRLVYSNKTITCIIQEAYGPEKKFRQNRS